MNRKLIKSIVLALFFAQFHFIIAGAMIAQPGLSALSDGQSVTLTWQTTSEENLSHFVVLRRTAESDSFVQLATVSPDDDHFYEYVDRNAYKTEDSIYIYKVDIVDNDGSVNGSSGEVYVLHQVSSARRTWGSIKALFR